MESVAPFATEGGRTTPSRTGKRIVSSTFVFYDADWIAAHKERVTAEQMEPTLSGSRSGHVSPGSLCVLDSSTDSDSEDGRGGGI